MHSQRLQQLIVIRIQKMTSMQSMHTVPDIFVTQIDEKIGFETYYNKKYAHQILNLTEIKQPHLQYIYSRDNTSTEAELTKISNMYSGAVVEKEYLTAFWFAIHIEDLQLAKMIFNRSKAAKLLVKAVIKFDPANQKTIKSNLSESGGSHSSSYGSEEEKGIQSSVSKSQRTSRSEKIKDKSCYEDNGDDTVRQMAEDQKKNKSVASLKSVKSSASYTNESQKSFKKVQKKNNQKQQQVDTSKTGQSAKNLSKSMISKSIMSAGGGGTNTDYLIQNDEWEVLKKSAFISFKDLIIDFQENSDEPYPKYGQEGSFSAKVSEQGIENVQFHTFERLKKIKLELRRRFQTLMTQILHECFRKNEICLAKIIAAYYELNLDEEFFKQAVKDRQIDFLFYLWGFQKNFTMIRIAGQSTLVTYFNLFEFIIQLHPNKTENRELISQVCNWGVKQWLDNILMALIELKVDDIAIEYMGIYKSSLNKELFGECLRSGNTQFLQAALTYHGFNRMIFRANDVMDDLLFLLEDGFRINFLLNVLVLTDMSVYKIKHLSRLVSILNKFVTERYEHNKLLLCSNPILAICLSCEVIKKIKQARKVFENDAKRIQTELLKLGNMYTSKITDDKYYEQLIMDSDFTGRLCIKIITKENLEPLMDENDPKAETTISQLWNGVDPAKCDGHLHGFSTLYYLITSKNKLVSRKTTSNMDIFNNNFVPNFDVDYTFQFRYRSKQISFYFVKDFICALLLLVIYQYINYKYLALFYIDYGPWNEGIDDPTSEFFGMTEDEYWANRVQFGIDDYSYSVYQSVLFSLALVLHLILKVIFNILSFQKVDIDKWSMLDTVCAFLNIGGVMLIISVDGEMLVDVAMKDYVDYFMILVLAFTWMRFFCYFLVIRSVSKLLLTLLAMLQETIAFILLCMCYLMIISSVFTTLFQDVKPESFGSLPISARILYDAILATYDYTGMDDKMVLYSVLLDFHVLFSHVILLNYLIAILSVTYVEMQQTGIFQYKCNLFQYCERYLASFKDDCYGALVIHPAPFNYLVLFILPILLCGSKDKARKANKCFQKFMFWVENGFLIFAFFFLEIFMIPFSFLKVLQNIFYSVPEVMNGVILQMVWVLFSPFYLPFLVFKDTKYFIQLLKMYEGCRAGRADELEEEQINEERKTLIYNEARHAIIQLYTKCRHEMKVAQNGENDVIQEKTEESVMTQEGSKDDEVFVVTEEEEDVQFMVKKSVIINEWKRMRYQKAKRENEERELKLLKQKTIGVTERRLSQVGISHNSSISPLMRKMKGAMAMKMSPGLKPRPMFETKAYQPLSPQITKKRTELMKLDSQQKLARVSALEKYLQKSETIKKDVVEVQEADVKLIQTFLNKFTIVSESSENEHMDIILFIKAIPKEIEREQIKKIDMFNFKIFQESLLAYQNLQIVSGFEYFDWKNAQRANGILANLKGQRSQLKTVEESVTKLIDKVEANQDFMKMVSTQVQEPQFSKKEFGAAADKATVMEAGGRAVNLIMALKKLQQREPDTKSEISQTVPNVPGVNIERLT